MSWVAFVKSINSILLNWLLSLPCSSGFHLKLQNHKNLLRFLINLEHSQSLAWLCDYCVPFPVRRVLCAFLGHVTDRAAVVHAAQGWAWLSGGGAGADAYRASGGRARWRLRVLDLQSSCGEEAVRVVSETLDQQVHIPLTVDQKVLSSVQIQTQGPGHLTTHPKVWHWINVFKGTFHLKITPPKNK